MCKIILPYLYTEGVADATALMDLAAVPLLLLELAEVVDCPCCHRNGHYCDQNLNCCCLNLDFLVENFLQPNNATGSKGNAELPFSN